MKKWKCRFGGSETPRIGSKPSRTPEEELRDRIAELERKNKDLQMENDLLKKVRELERRDRFL